MVKRLTEDFYLQPALSLAKELLGKYIVRRVGGKKMVGKIIETEAYIGPRDRAAHSYLPPKILRSKTRECKGKITPRNKIVYLAGGRIYIYLVYGMHWQLNITAAEAGRPECVLIRAIEPQEGDIRLTNGPAKVCRYFKLDKSFYGRDLTKSKAIWLEDRGQQAESGQILAAKRVGIDYAGPYWSGRKWRFLIKNYQKYLPK
jgi:DNA-3-methyladenine glycosylase